MNTSFPRLRLASALALGTSLLPRVAISSPECKATTRIKGERQVVEEIEAALRRRNVSVGDPSDPCEAVTVAVSADSTGWSLRREGAGGPIDLVLVSNLPFAVLLIESWAKSDLGRFTERMRGRHRLPEPSEGRVAHQLEASAEPPGDAPRTAGEPTNPEASRQSLHATLDRPDRSSIALVSQGLTEANARLGGAGADLSGDGRAIARTVFLAARAEAGASDDGAAWLGGLARTAIDLESFGGWVPWVGFRGSASPAHKSQNRATSTARTEVGVLLGVDHPIFWGDLSLTAGIALGAAWFESRRVTSEIPACVSSGACAWEGGSIIRDGLRDRHIGPRADTSIGAAYRLSSNLSLQLLLTLSLAPFSDSDPIEPSYARALPEEERSKIAIEPEPRAVARGALSIEWGAL